MAPFCLQPYHKRRDSIRQAQAGARLSESTGEATAGPQRQGTTAQRHAAPRIARPGSQPARAAHLNGARSLAL